jgi:hypothetical protein
MRASHLLSGTAALLLTACTMTPDGGEPQSLTALAPTAPSAVQPGSPPDLSGSWNWSNVEVLRMPSFVAIMVGIKPEGLNTQARCESAGTMTLVQTGASFSGSAARTFNACETKGGQFFQQPGTAFQISDGRITGSSIHFSFSSPFVSPCPHRATISAVEGGIAGALNGTGGCILPGHPQSESPVQLNPPPGGTSQTIAWTATRP